MSKLTKVPTPPNPTDMANAQGLYNRVNQYTPGGNIVHGYVGDNGEFMEGQAPDGQRHAVQSQESDFQKQYRTGAEGGALNLQSTILGNYGLDGQGGGSLPGAPQIEDMSDLRQEYYDANIGLVTENFDRDIGRQETKLQNRGIPIGALAFNDGMTPLLDSQQRAKTGVAADAINYAGNEQSRRFNLGNTARSSAIAEVLAQTTGGANPTQPLDIGAIPSVDIGGYMRDNYSNQVQASGQQKSSIGGVLGAIGGFF